MGNQKTFLVEMQTKSSSRLLRFRRIVEERPIFEYEVLEGENVGGRGVMSGALILWLMRREYMRLETEER